MLAPYMKGTYISQGWTGSGRQMVDGTEADFTPTPPHAKLSRLDHERSQGAGAHRAPPTGMPLRSVNALWYNPHRQLRYQSAESYRTFQVRQRSWVWILEEAAHVLSSNTLGGFGRNPLCSRGPAGAEFQRRDYGRGPRQLPRDRAGRGVDAAQRGDGSDGRGDRLRRRRRILVSQPRTIEIRGDRDEARLPTGGAVQHRRDAQFRPARRSRVAGGGADRARRGRRWFLDAEHDRHAGARHLAGDAPGAAAAHEQRAARGRQLCDPDARRQHRWTRERVRRADQ